MKSLGKFENRFRIMVAVESKKAIGGGSFIFVYAYVCMFAHVCILAYLHAYIAMHLNSAFPGALAWMPNSVSG